MTERRARYHVAATPEAARDLLYRQVPEEELLQRVRSWLTFNGWLSWHQRDSRRSDEGWPDLTCLRPAKLGRWQARMALIECKRERRWLSPAQITTLRAWAQQGDVEVYVVRPSTWPDLQPAWAQGSVPDRYWWMRRLEEEIARAEGQRPEDRDMAEEVLRR